MKVKRIAHFLTALALLASFIPSCTWRQIGRSTGGIGGYLLAITWINGENESRKAKGLRPLTDGEEQQIAAVATALGMALGAELGGAMGEYVAKKREEYRTETEYLNAQINGVNKSIRKADAELTWLNEQSSTLKKQADNIRSLPGAKKEVAAKIKESATKHEQDVNELDEHLRAARADTLQAYRNTKDKERKQQLQQNIKALDERIAATRKVRNNILAASNSVAYL